MGLRRSGRRGNRRPGWCQFDEFELEFEDPFDELFELELLLEFEDELLLEFDELFELELLELLDELLLELFEPEFELELLFEFEFEFELPRVRPRWPWRRCLSSSRTGLWLALKVVAMSPPIWAVGGRIAVVSCRPLTPACPATGTKIASKAGRAVFRMRIGGSVLGCAAPTIGPLHPQNAPGLGVIPKVLRLLRIRWPRSLPRPARAG